MSRRLFNDTTLDNRLRQHKEEFLNEHSNNRHKLNSVDPEVYFNTLHIKYFVKLLELKNVRYTDHQYDIFDAVFELNGSEFLLYARPNTYTTTYPIGILNVKKNVIDFRKRFILSQIRASDTTKFIQDETKKFQEELVFYINAQKEEVTEFNDYLENQITKLFEEHKELNKLKDHLAKELNIEVNRDTNNFISETVKELKIEKSKVPKFIKNIESTEEYETISLSIYKDVLNTISYIGKSIEKKPSIYKDRSEENLRDIFQIILETRYDNTTVTGETFNKSGKTDILISSTNQDNLFIAELKNWSGENKIIKDLEQLEGYLTIRDSKSCLIYFIDRKDFKLTMNKLIDKIKESEMFVKVNSDNYLENNGETLIFKNGGYEYYLHVMGFHYPN